MAKGLPPKGMLLEAVLDVHATPHHGCVVEK